MIKLKPLIVSLAISLGVGGLAGLLTRGSMESYMQLTKPALSPPPWVFPAVWTLLYILMGISAYMIYMTKSPNKGTALKLYAIQLGMNFVWPLLFFGAQMYLLSFVWLVVLWLLVLLMVVAFYRIRPVAGLLQLPYLLWITFAGYLNLMIYLLNR